MSKSAHDQKVLFAATLRPFLEMLEHQRRVMHAADWKAHVNKFLIAIVNNPEQYLGQNLPPRETTTTLILEIFSEVSNDLFQERSPFAVDGSRLEDY